MHATVASAVSAEAAAALLAVPGAGEAELSIPPSTLQAMRDSLDARGYGAMQPGAGWDWQGPTPSLLQAMYAAAGALRAAGWPPAFVFALPGAWRLIDRLFAPMEALLGEGCEMDPSVFCWIASRPEALNVPAPP